MQAIAAEAGVAVQTLYFTFATKRAILKELLDVEVAGDTAPIATLDRPWVAEAMAAGPLDQIRMQVAAAAAILARVVPVLDVVRSAAAADPEIAELWRTDVDQRHTVLTAFAGALAAKTTLLEGINAARAADIMLAVLSPETYHLLVHQRGWSGEAWQEWAADALVRQLLPDPPAAPGRRRASTSD
jgi:AcrR family transcriptional regulator